MRLLKTTSLPAVLGVLALVACEDTAVDPAFDDLTAAEQLELSVLADQGSFDIAVDFASVTNGVAMDRGHAGAFEGTSLNSDARAAFAEARRAWMDGDHRRALDASRVARRLVARALIATGGVPAVEDLIERLEDILLTVDSELFDDPDALRAELEAIIAEAHALLEAGDSVGAAARAILGEQRARLRRGRHHRPGDIDPDRARIEVALAGSAVALAERLITTTPADPVTDAASSDISDRQNRWLAHAQNMLARAEEALSNGHLARAVHWAHHAQWSALKAVVLPGGITEEEIRAMHELATTSLAEAVSEIPDPSELQARLLNRAAELIEIGVRRLEAGHKRGIAALWRAAVISVWLIS